MGYTKTAASGLSWVGLFRVLLRISSLIKTAILARLLTPAQFGLFGIASLALGLLEMFTETGINVFLIQEKSDSVEEYLDTAFFVSVIRGFIISLFILTLTPIISSFFQTTSVKPLIQLIALVPVIRGFINPSIVSFQKNLNFKQDFFFRSSLIFAESLVAIGIALIIHSPVSLVWGLITSALLEVILSHRLLPHRPHFRFLTPQLSKILNQGKWVTSAGILAYLTKNLPDITLGKLLNPAALGQYQMSFKFAALPVEEINETFNRVTFPIYTRIASEKTRLTQAFLKNSLVILILSSPLLILSWYFPDVIVNLALGDKWQPVIPMIQQMTLVALGISLAAPSNPLFLATKNQKLLSYTILIQLIILCLFLITQLNSPSVSGLIYAYAMSILASVPARYFFSYQILKS